MAQRVTKELTDLFISENLEARQEQSENTTQFLESHLEEARKSLTGQEERLREFKDQHLGDLPGQLQSNLQILGGLQGQLGGEQEALNRAKQQNVYLQSLLGQYRLVQRSSKSGDTASVGLPAIEQELERLQTRLADLSSHYTERHPDVRKVKEQIANAERMKQQISESLKAKAAAAQTDDASTSATKSGVEITEVSPTAELDSQLKVNQIEIVKPGARSGGSEGKNCRLSGASEPRTSARTTIGRSHSRLRSISHQLRIPAEEEKRFGTFK